MSFTEWLRGNFWTLAGVAVIMAVVVLDLMTVQTKIHDKLVECNDYWRDRVEDICPMAANGDYESGKVDIFDTPLVPNLTGIIPQ